jgi:outer membrane protein TolC
MDRIATEKTKLKMEIEEAVGVAFNSLKEARKRLMSTEKGLAASQESYNRQKKRFNARIGTISEVLDAQSMLARAESIKSQTLLDCRIYMAQLYHAMGLGQSPSDPSAPGPSGSGQIKPEMDK